MKEWICIMVGIPLLILSGRGIAFSYTCDDFVPGLGTVLSMRDQGIHNPTTIRFIKEYSKSQNIGIKWSRAFLKMTDDIYDQPPILVSKWVTAVLAWCKKHRSTFP